MHDESWDHVEQLKCTLSTYFQQKKVGLTLLSRVHLSVNAESDSVHFQFLTQHYCQKLGLSTEVEFLSEPMSGLISSSKSEFRYQDQIFWLDRTSKKQNPNLLLNQHYRISAPNPDPTS